MTHRDLIVWQKSMDMVTELYVVTRAFPHEEIYGITAQMRRAAISIPSNIAEGYGRDSSKELLHFLYISLGSASELETQLAISKAVGLMNEDNYTSLNAKTCEIIRLLSALINSVKNRNK